MHKKNALWFRYLLVIIIFIFLFRLIQLQIIQHSLFFNKAKENAARTTPIIAPRGIIYDANGKVLLKNKPVFSVYILPHLLPKNESYVFKKLAGLLKVPYSEILKRYKSKKTLFEGILIASDVPLSIVSRLEEEKPQLKGVEIICYPMRLYPYNSAGVHVLGYIGEVESQELKKGYRLGCLIGKDGVEKTYDRYLRGSDGGRVLKVDAFGRPLGLEDVITPTPGSDLYLTIDLDLQLAVEEALSPYEGAVVVLDPKSGKILAMASRPSYDANLEWEQIDQKNHPFMNRALSTYPPGSIFKVVTLTTALESKKVKLTEMINCWGGYKLGLRYAKCWLERGHGLLDPLEGLVWSCDVVFYELGKRCGVDLMSDYAMKYGLGNKLGIDLPQEKKGFIPTSSWKKNALNEIWYEGDSINMGIGQGFVQVTPLQMASVYSQIATGKRYRPYVVEKIVDKKGEILYQAEIEEEKISEISPETLKLIRGALREVIRRGTGVAANVPGLPAAGKTGTAENPGKAHAWFICYAPYDDPEIVICSFVAHGEHGDRAPAYIARKILTWYKENRLKREIPPEKPVNQYILHGRRVEWYRVKPQTPSEPSEPTTGE